MTVTSIGGSPPAVPPPAPARPGAGTSTDTHSRENVAQVDATAAAKLEAHREQAKLDQAKLEATRPKPLPPLKGLSVEEVRVILGAIPPQHLPAVRGNNVGASRDFDSYA